MKVAQERTVETHGLEQPGVFPFTRGAASEPETEGWFATYYTGAGTARDTNALFRERFGQGIPSLLLAMDLPTQLGLDPDDPMAIGEVGRIGVAVSSLDDAVDLFDGIRLDLIATGTVGNSIGIYTCPLFELLGRNRGLSARDLRITLQNDPLKEYTGRGTQIFPLSIAIQLAADVVEYVHSTLRANWKPQYTCTTQMRWGGVSASQELGFGLSSLHAYVEAAGARGVEPTHYLRRTELHMSSDNDFFEEIAKFRAARRLWATIVAERYGRAVAEACPLKITVFTAGNRLTAQRPLNNVVRTTVHILAAMLGGVSEMLVPGYDEALGLPSKEATALTNATKQILHFENGIGDGPDPLGGAAYVEQLTDNIADEARHWFEVIQEYGGIVEAVNAGVIRQASSEGLYKQHLEIETGERRVVGLNFGDMEQAPMPATFRTNPDAEAEQIARVMELRTRRAQTRVDKTLSRLAEAARRKLVAPTHNIVPDVRECVAERATVGEVFRVLRSVFGEAHTG